VIEETVRCHLPLRSYRSGDQVPDDPMLSSVKAGILGKLVGDGIIRVGRGVRFGRRAIFLRVGAIRHRAGRKHQRGSERCCGCEGSHRQFASRRGVTLHQIRTGMGMLGGLAAPE